MDLLLKHQIRQTKCSPTLASCYTDSLIQHTWSPPDFCTPVYCGAQQIEQQDPPRACRLVDSPKATPRAPPKTTPAFSEPLPPPRLQCTTPTRQQRRQLRKHRLTICCPPGGCRRTLELPPEKRPARQQPRPPTRSYRVPRLLIEPGLLLPLRWNETLLGC